jgi:hypothetical protein
VPRPSIHHNQIALLLRIRSGHLTLTGHVSTLIQRAAGDTAVRFILSFKGIANRSEVTSGPSTGDVRHPITRALRREAEFDARASR